MIFIMAYSDLVVVVVFHSLIMFKIIVFWENIDVFSPTWIYYSAHLFVISFTAYFAMTLERYLALVYPFFHEKLVTKSRLVSAFVLFQLLFAFLYVSEFYSRHLALATNALFEVGLVVTCILNFKMFFSRKNNKKRHSCTTRKL